MNIFTELKHAFRQLAARPLYTLLAIGVLSGGLGCSLFMLSAINAMVLEPLPFPHAERLVSLGYAPIDNPDDTRGLPQKEFLEWQREQRAFERFAGWGEGTINLSDELGPVRYDGAFVTGQLFELIGAQAALGRGIVEADDAPGAPYVVVISDRTWRDRYGADPGVLGRSIRANGRAATIVGVMPPKFAFPIIQQVWLPARLDLRTTPDTELGLSAMGRLAEGGALAQATAQLEATMAELAKRFPQTAGALQLKLQPLAYRFVSRHSVKLVSLLFATSLFVLLLACANASNLLLGQTIARRRELAVRAAIGASRGRLMLNVLTECLLLALVSAAIGLFLAHLGGRWVLDVLTMNDDLPAYWIDFHIDARMVAFALGFAAFTTLVAGLIPAARASGASLNEAMRDGEKGGSGGGFARFARGLVIAEIALSFVLLVSAGVSVRLLQSMLSADVGTHTAPEQLLTGRVALFPNSYPQGTDQVAFFERLVERLRSEPGVIDATGADALPGTIGGGDEVAIEGTPSDERRYPEVFTGSIDDHFLATYGVTLRDGRAFDARDAAGSEPVAIVDADFAAKFLPGRDILGRKIKLSPRDPESAWRTVVGVVQTMQLEDVDDPHRPTVLVPMRQQPRRFVSVAIHVEGDAMAFAPRFAEIVRSLDADTPVYWMRTHARALEMARGGPVILAKIFSTFGLLGLVLAAAGLYGVLAFAVEQRTREIGLRRAIGASVANVLHTVLGRSAWQVAIGVAIGIALGVPWARMLAGQFQDGGMSFSLLIFPAVGALIALVAALAALVPARRAMRVDPMTALRYE